MLNWDDLRIFLAIRRHRTLAGAAKELRVTQSTVGRRLTAMQEGLGVRLMHRTTDGYQLTVAGESILMKAERVEAAALELERAAAAHDLHQDCTVRVATSPMLASHLLAPGFASLVGRKPAILVEISASAPIGNAARHQADISVQLTRFEHHDLVMRSLGAMQFGLYASVDYLERFGRPNFQHGCAGHQIIAMADAVEWSQHTKWRATCLAQASVVIRSDSFDMQQAAALHGSGLAVLPRFRGDAEPTLCRLHTLIPVPPSEIWLAVHRENRQHPPVRIVVDTIASTVRSRSADLDPPSCNDEGDG
jgi:DNA-binding transcriptional LysR family regulator